MSSRADPLAASLVRHAVSRGSSGGEPDQAFYRGWPPASGDASPAAELRETPAAVSADAQRATKAMRLPRRLHVPGSSDEGTASRQVVRAAPRTVVLRGATRARRARTNGGRHKGQ